MFFVAEIAQTFKVDITFIFSFSALFFPHRIGRIHPSKTFNRPSHAVQRAAQKRREESRIICRRFFIVRLCVGIACRRRNRARSVTRTVYDKRRRTYEIQEIMSAKVMCFLLLLFRLRFSDVDKSFSSN